MKLSTKIRLKQTLAGKLEDVTKTFNYDNFDNSSAYACISASIRKISQVINSGEQIDVQNFASKFITKHYSLCNFLILTFWNIRRVKKIKPPKKLKNNYKIM